MRLGEIIAIIAAVLFAIILSVLLVMYGKKTRAINGFSSSPMK